MLLLSVLLEPDSAVYVVDVAEDDSDNLARHIGGPVVGRNAKRASSNMCPDKIDRLNQATAEYWTHDQSTFVHTLWPFVSFADHHCGETEEGGFFSERSTVRDYTK